MSVTPCQTDQDCPGSLVCYMNVSWSDVTGGFCDCESVYYGWIGLQCDEFGPTTLFVLILASVTTVISTFLLLVGAGFAVDILRHGKLRKWNNMSQTFVLINLYEVSWIVYSVGQILERVMPEGMQQTGLNGEKRHNFANLVQGGSFMIILVFLICGFNVTTVWLDIAYQVESMRGQAHLRWIRWVARGSQLYTLAAIIYMLASQNFTITFFALLPVGFGCVGFYTLARYRFIKVLKRFATAEGMQANMVPLIERTHAVIFVTLLLSLAFTLIAAILTLGDPRDMVPAGTLSVVMVILYLAALFAWVGGVAIFMYTVVILYAARLKALGPHLLDTAIRAVVSRVYPMFPSESDSTATHLESKKDMQQISQT